MTVDLTPAMIYYSRRYRARLIGVTTDTDFLAALKRYALETVLPQEQAVLQRLSQAAFYQGVITESERQIEKLIKGAQTIEQKREVHPQVTRLYETAEKALKKLETMNDGS